MIGYYIKSYRTITTSAFAVFDGSRTHEEANKIIVTGLYTTIGTSQIFMIGTSQFFILLFADVSN